jgi:hypothetical protein
VKPGEVGMRDTSTYDQICDDFALILPHLSVAISMKAEIYFHRNSFIAISMIQVCMETSKKLSLHVSPPSRSVNPIHHRNWDENLCQTNNLRHRC